MGLVLVILLVFSAAFAAEFAGIVPREAAGDAEDAAGGGKEALSDLTEQQLRIGVIGGFVVLCIFVLIRRSEV